jgi:hypothetical protein
MIGLARQIRSSISMGMRLERVIQTAVLSASASVSLARPRSDTSAPLP